MPDFEPRTRNEALLNAIRENTGGGTGSVDFEPRTRNEYLLNEIRKNTEGGGSGLPDVTTADNGKVFGVENGAWGAVENLPNVTLNDFTHIDNTVELSLTEAQSALLPVGDYVYALDWYRDEVFMCNIIPQGVFRVVKKA